MAVNLSPIWGAGAQLLDNSGNVLSGGKIYTYAAGTTTQVTTFTDGSGITANSNPIILNSAGRVPYEIWLTDGQNYKFVLKDSNDVLIGTWDNLSGINSNFIAYTNQQEIQTATAGQTVFNLTTMNYLPATNSLSVFVDGVNQYGPGALYAYEETDSNTVTFTSGLHDGAEVKFTSSQIQNAGIANASQITYDPPFTNAVAESVQSRLAQTISVKDFGAAGDGVTDDTSAIIYACQAANTAGILEVYIPNGTYLHTTLNLTDLNVCLVGNGVNSTTLKYIGTTANDGIKFGTSQLATKKINGCGLKYIKIDANSLARRAVEVTSVWGAVFDNVQIINPYSYGMYWTCLDNILTNAQNQPADNQRCHTNDLYVECITPNNATAVFLTGNLGTASTVGANTSLNHFQNVRLNIRNGDGFVFGSADGNTLISLFVYRPVANTGRGLVFQADDTNSACHARTNMCFNTQTAISGVYALAGTGVKPSYENFVGFNNGNAGDNYQPTVETGATLSWISQSMIARMGMWRGVFVGGTNKTVALAAVRTQEALVTTESQRIYNTSANHTRFVDGSGNEWSLNIDGATGDLRFSRISGTGEVAIASLLLGGKQVSTGIADSGGTGYRVLRVPN